MPTFCKSLKLNCAINCSGFPLCFGYSNKAGKSGTPPIFELPIATVSCCFGTTFIQGNTVLISSSFKCVSSYLSINTSIFLFINSPYIYILIYIIVQRLYFILYKINKPPKTGLSFVREQV
ncbi:Uncharacterised protein [Streptococcus pneumoniae]|nr:Uncharacterised protein [Streptococcus pneumoniae]